MSHKVQECGPITAEATWGTEPLIRSPEHCPDWSSATLLFSNEHAKATVLLGLRILLRMKMSTYGSVLPPTVLVLPLHSAALNTPHSAEEPLRAGL